MRKLIKISLYLLYSIADVVSSFALLQLWSFFIDFNKYEESSLTKVSLIVFFTTYIVIKTCILLFVYYFQPKKSKLINEYRLISIIDIILLGAIFLVIILYGVFGVIYGHNIIVVLLSTLLTIFCAILLCSTNISLYFVCKHRVKGIHNDGFSTNKKSKSIKKLVMIISIMINVFFDIILQLFTTAFLLTPTYSSDVIPIVFVGILKTILFVVLASFSLLSVKKSLLLMLLDFLFVIPFSVFVTVTAHSFEMIIILYVICALTGSVIGSCISLVKKRLNLHIKNNEDEILE